MANSRRRAFEKAYSQFLKGHPFWTSFAVRSPSDCWLWTRGRDAKGYGVTSWNKKRTTTHRLSYTLSVGPIPDGKLILHTCDNPPCGNPLHLRAGTRIENLLGNESRGLKPARHMR